MKVKKTWTDFILVSWIVTYVLVILGQFLVLIPGIRDLFTYLLNNPVEWVQTAGMYFQTAPGLVLFLIVMAVFKKNRPMLKTLTPYMKGNRIQYALLGLLGGFACNGICVLISVLTGDIKLSFAGFELIPFLFLFLSVLIQSGSEEVICRGYLFQRIRRHYHHPAWAIVGNAALFGLLHVLNPDASVLGITQVVEAGLLFSLMVYFMDSIWCAIGFHTAWNFTQSILFGLPNSGNVVPYSFFRLEAASARNGLFYNVGFGVEGSIGASLILLLAIIALLVWGIQHKKKPTDVYIIVENEEE